MGRAATFSMQETPEGGRTRVTLFGELDLDASPRFERRMAALRKSTAGIRLDLSRLDFMDCSGYRAVVGVLSDHRRGLSPLELDPHVSPRSAAW